MIYLLDINVLIALCDAGHIHHELAHSWFDRKGSKSWATCPLTENGFVRVASHPSYPNRPGNGQEVLALLMQFTSLPGHHFWPDIVRLGEALLPKRPFSHSQVTDLYLVALAVKHQGRLATLDGRIHPQAVNGGDNALELIKVT